MAAETNTLRLTQLIHRGKWQMLIEQLMLINWRIQDTQTKNIDAFYIGKQQHLYGCAVSTDVRSDAHKLNNQNTPPYMLSMFEIQTRHTQYRKQSAHSIAGFVIYFSVLSTQSWTQVCLRVIQQKQKDAPLQSQIHASVYLIFHSLVQYEAYAMEMKLYILALVFFIPKSSTTSVLIDQVYILLFV